MVCIGVSFSIPFVPSSEREDDEVFGSLSSGNVEANPSLGEMEASGEKSGSPSCSRTHAGVKLTSSA